MTGSSHQSLVSDQFGPRAGAYLTSAVHAEGEDLVQMREAVQGRKDWRVLDLGCGAGHVAFRVAPEVREVVAVDLSADMLRAVSEEAGRRGLSNIVTECSPVERLPFPDASFDAVMSRYSAHHWHGFAAGLREARRVLKSEGLAIFVDAVSPGPALLDTHMQAVELLRDPSHVRDYSENEWLQALIRAGFAPGDVTRRRLPLDFASWIARMRTPEPHVQAIRSLQQRASDEIVRHFDIRPDGSFTIDTILIGAMAEGDMPPMR
jgi:ubiquinone/menaquinone biosynthesis C-methylase UbiE